MSRVSRIALWTAVAGLGAAAFGVPALSRGVGEFCESQGKGVRCC